MEGSELELFLHFYRYERLMFRTLYVIDALLMWFNFTLNWNLLCLEIYFKVYLHFTLMTILEVLIAGFLVWVLIVLLKFSVHRLEFYLKRHIICTWRFLNHFKEKFYIYKNLLVCLTIPKLKDINCIV